MAVQTTAEEKSNAEKTWRNYYAVFVVKREGGFDGFCGRRVDPGKGEKQKNARRKVRGRKRLFRSFVIEFAWPRVGCSGNGIIVGILFNSTAV